ncbi:MAG TPA: imidazoleglycerol-phosphate dehydratase HisB [Firmicutes bacterium]|nr:imidazoleglycerol-phosphate dehydratase HisB [Bacillota bacterium]
MAAARKADLRRTTRETDIRVSLCLDGGEVEISTGIGFFDHMLEALAVHGGLGLKVSARGDLQVDCHHTIEDTGILLGKALAEAVGDRAGIARYGSFFIPMDEALAACHLDISGRPYLVFQGGFPEERVGGFDTCMTEEFMRAFCVNGGVTLHISCPYGKNSHHMIEAMFKALAHALRIALAPTAGGALSTKGVL